MFILRMYMNRQDTITINSSKAVQIKTHLQTDREEQVTGVREDNVTGIVSADR